MLMQADQDLQETQVDQDLDLEADFLTLCLAWVARACAQEALFGDLDLDGAPALGQALQCLFLCLHSCV